MMTDLALPQALHTSYAQLQKPARILVAFSGGADSLALLHALHRLQETEDFELLAVHINHGLRKSAVRDAAFAAKFAASLKIPFYLQEVTVSRQGNLEANAREARYQACMDVLSQSNADILALAHHADDQAETLLMHLMSGSGLAGLCGMAQWSTPYWRPLLGISKEDILRYLDAYQLTWVNDESNQDLSFTRNYLRTQVMPLLESRSPGVSLRMARTVSILQAEQETLEQMAASWLRLHAKLEPPFCFLMKAPFLAQDVALQRRLLRRVCSSLGIPLNFEQTEGLRQFVISGKLGAYTLPCAAKANLSKDRLHILPDAVESLAVRWQHAQIVPASSGLGDGRKTQAVDALALTGAQMRQAQLGDVISPLGMQGTQPLRKYLSAKGVDLPFRPFYPVLAKGNEVLWVPGYGISSKAAITDATSQRVMLQFVGKLPDEI